MVGSTMLSRGRIAAWAYVYDRRVAAWSSTSGLRPAPSGPLWKAVESGEFDVIQMPRLYTLLNTTSKDTRLLAAAGARNMRCACTAWRYRRSSMLSDESKSGVASWESVCPWPG